MKIAKIKENLNEMGKSLPMFDSLGEVVGSTVSNPPSEENGASWSSGGGGGAETKLKASTLH